MGFWDVLGKIGKTAAGFIPGVGPLIGAGISAAGDMASAGAETAAGNRGTKLDASLVEESLNQNRKRDFMDQLIARSQEGRTSSTDAWKKLQQGEYLGTATEGYKPKNGLPSYGFGPKAATESERLAGASMRDESLKRFREGNPIPEVQDPGQFKLNPEYMNAGMWEKLGGILGPGLSTFGALAERSQPRKLTLEELAMLGQPNEIGRGNLNG
jgi:hypothetical protein